MASLHNGLQRHGLPTEENLQQPDEGSEHEKENEDAEDQGEANPERTAHPEPRPRCHHTDSRQLEGQEDDEHQGGQKSERTKIDVDRTRGGHCFLSTC